MAKLLFIDDEKDFLDFMDTYFKGQGHEVLTTPLGQTGLKLILEEKPDVAVIDLRLKGELDGMDVIKQTYARAPEQRMILFTGYKDPAMDAEAMRHGVGICLHKPMAGLPELEEAITFTIEGKN